MCMTCECSDTHVPAALEIPTDLVVLARLGVRVYLGVKCTSRLLPDLDVLDVLAVRVYSGANSRLGRNFHVEHGF